MESINVVINDEIRAHSKGEISQCTLGTLPSLTGNRSETSSLTGNRSETSLQ
jgi:hypothetical protein